MAEQKRKRTISGPGASDFLASPGGEDLPGVSPGKGMSDARGESPLDDPRNLEPGLLPEEDALADERRSGVPANAAPERSGSQSGTVGGGGPDARNPHGVRATGIDDPTVEKDERER